MESMQLGKTTLEVPRLGLGVMTWGEPTGFSLFNPAKMAYGGPAAADDEAQAFEASLKAGVTLFDTAEMYSAGASETRLGVLAEHRQAFLASKFPPHPFAGPERLPRELDATLQRLRRTSVDLFQHHFPTSTKAIPRLMELMADAVQAGKVRAVGVSNYSADQMRLAHKVLADRGLPLASNQVQYSLLHRKPETNGVLDACRELGVTLIAYQPLASGALTGKFSRANPPKGMRKMMPYLQTKNLADLERVVALLQKIGNAHNKTPAQIALRWLLENPVVLPIPGAKSAAQAQANAGALGFRLSADECRELDDATKRWMV